MRGTLEQEAGPGSVHDGSSPRMRGTLTSLTSPPAPARFIPAHAGNSGHLEPSGLPLPVHPRACGELEEIARDADFSRGSSPRMRGTRHLTVADRVSRRFIPAHAGNSHHSEHRRCRESVHPRACGELGFGDNSDYKIVGSSPRMRGTQRGVGRRSCRNRFIPAHAGNSAAVPAASVCNSVHPRACGELSSTSEQTYHLSGSSPRMRGTPRR